MLPKINALKHTYASTNLRWPVTVIPWVFFKLHVRTWNSTCARRHGCFLHVEFKKTRGLTVQATVRICLLCARYCDEIVTCHIPPPNSSSYFGVSAIFGIVILMTFAATLDICGVTSRLFYYYLYGCNRFLKSNRWCVSTLPIRQVTLRCIFLRK